MGTATQTMFGGRWLALSLVLACASCLDTASKTNDNTQSAAGASGTGTAGAGAGAAGAGAGATAGAAAGGGGTPGAVAGAGGAATGPAAGSGGGGAPVGGASAEDDAGVVTGGAGAAGGGEAGVAGGEAGSGAAGAPSTAPDPTLVMGTGANCSSYGEPANGKCGGYFCGVDLATLQKAVDPMAKCGGDIDQLCRNVVITAVGMCARQVKSQMPLASNDELSPMVEACVFQDAAIKAKTTPECLACTITAAECAGDMCLAECLAGDSAQCDACRKMNNCDQPVFACGGLPSPL